MDDYLKTLLDQHSKTERTLTSIKLGAKGWSGRNIVPENLRETQVCMYIWDQPTAFTWVCSLPARDFVTISQSAADMNAEADFFRNGVTSCLFEAIARPDADDWECSLGLVLAAYAGTTETWRAAGGMATGGHFMVLNYRAPGATAGRLRPFAAISPGCREPLSADVWAERVNAVLAGDRIRHPEWFRTS